MMNVEVVLCEGPALFHLQCSTLFIVDVSRIAPWSFVFISSLVAHPVIRRSTQKPSVEVLFDVPPGLVQLGMK